MESREWSKLRGGGLLPEKQKPRLVGPAGVSEIVSISHGQGTSGLPERGRLAHVVVMVVENHELRRI